MDSDGDGINDADDEDDDNDGVDDDGNDEDNYTKFRKKNLFFGSDRSLRC